MPEKKNTTVKEPAKKPSDAKQTSPRLRQPEAMADTPVTENDVLKKEIELLKRELAESRKLAKMKEDAACPFDKEKEMKPVKVLFKNLERPGAKIEWYDRFPWRGAIMTKYEITDNQTDDLPYYVVRRMMKKGSKPMYKDVKGPHGTQGLRVVDYKRRWEFIPLDGSMIIEPDRKLTRVITL